MSVKRLGLLTVGALGLALTLGAAQGGAVGSPGVVALYAPHVQLTWLMPGRESGPATGAATTIGSQAILSARLYNRTIQFGKPTGSTVGRLLLDCTVLNVPTDGNCTGIVHLPNGFFLIGGNGPFVVSPRHYAITGGVGPYATARGQVTITTTPKGVSVIDAVLGT
jgi:hypothetical protein